MPAISFILPVYNMEAYLPRVIRSLKQQTLADFEAIFVNDGSRDNSSSLIAQAAAENPRFRLIDKANGGVASARNAALDAASGEYVFFLDPDDWIEPDTAELLIQSAQKENADFVQAGMFHDVYDESGRLLHSSVTPPPLRGVCRGEPFKEHFDKLGSSYLVIGKLFRRALLEQLHLRFPARQLGEDGLFYAAFYRSSPGCLVFLDKPLYHYTLARKASLSNSYHPERLQDNFYLSDAVWDTVAQWGLLESPLHLQKARYCTLRDLMMGIKNLSLSPLSLAEQTAWLCTALRTDRVRRSVQNTPLRSMHSRNDRIKLLLLKLHLCRMVVLLSRTNQSKKN